MSARLFSLFGNREPSRVAIWVPVSALRVVVDRIAQGIDRAHSKTSEVYRGGRCTWFCAGAGRIADVCCYAEDFRSLVDQEETIG